MDVHDGRGPRAAIWPRGTRWRTSGTCCGRSASTPATRFTTPWRWPETRQRKRASTRRLAAAGVGPLARARRHPRQRRQRRSGAGRRRRSRIWPPAWCEHDAQRRVVVTAGPSEPSAARAIAKRARDAARTRAARSILDRRLRPDGASRARRPCLGVHWRRQRAAARGRHDPDADRGAAGPDAAGTVAAVARPALVQPRSIELSLPCRPCHQRSASLATSAA